MLAEEEEVKGGRRGQEREEGKEEGGGRREEDFCLTCQKHLSPSLTFYSSPPPFHSLRRAWSLSFLLACTLRAL